MRTTNNIGYLLQHVSSLLAKQSDQVLREQLGIGLAQFKILRLLQSEPRTTQREIAFHLGQTEASISRQVKLMIEEGLLHSVRGLKDHREHLTAPTRKGLRLTNAALEVLARFHHPTFASLNDKQQEQLIATLESLHRQVCASDHPHPVTEAKK